MWGGRAMPEALVVGAQLAVGTVFGTAVLGKFRGGLASFARTVESYGILPPPLTRPLAYAVLAAEACVAFTLLAGVRPDVGAVAALLLVLAFLAAVLINLRRDHRVPCGCFGAEDETISARSVLRLGLLLAGAAWLVGAAMALDAHASGLRVVASGTHDLAGPAVGLGAFMLATAAWAMNGREAGTLLLESIRGKDTVEDSHVREA
jgi:uncharacterized membrane protein YphA (DoxX/SURF4 family)